MNTPQQIYAIKDRQPEFPLNEFVARYEVFADGRIWSRRGFRWLKVHYSKSGYANVSLDLPGIKSFRLHRLVALICIPNPENKPEVNHKDGDKNNNAVSNLEWVTHKENCDHARDVLGQSNQFEKGKNNSPRTVLSQADIQVIKMRYVAGDGPAAIAKTYGIHRKHVSKIVANKVSQTLT